MISRNLTFAENSGTITRSGRRKPKEGQEIPLNQLEHFSIIVNHTQVQIASVHINDEWFACL